MTFGLGRINFAPNAAGSWQLAMADLHLNKFGLFRKG